MKENRTKYIIIGIVVILLVGIGVSVKQAVDIIGGQEIATRNVHVGSYKSKDLKLEPGKYGISDATNEDGIVKIDGKTYELEKQGPQVVIFGFSQSVEDKIVHEVVLDEDSTIEVSGDDAFQISFWKIKE